MFIIHATQTTRERLFSCRDVILLREANNSTLSFVLLSPFPCKIMSIKNEATLYSSLFSFRETTMTRKNRKNTAHHDIKMEMMMKKWAALRVKYEQHEKGKSVSSHEECHSFLVEVEEEISHPPTASLESCTTTDLPSLHCLKGNGEENRKDKKRWRRRKRCRNSMRDRHPVKQE